jgi:hypothetical protein
VRFEPTDLSRRMREGIEPPEQLYEGLVYREGVHWFSGHPGCGKTTLVMHIALESMRAAQHVIWLDYEAGEYQTALRLRDMGATADEVEEFFHYFPFPATTLDDAAVAGVEALWERWPGALGVYDSASKALSEAGLDENKPPEVTEWAAELTVKIAKRQHVPILVIDHVTKAEDGSGRYARGSGSKLADCEVSWYVDQRRLFTRERVGEIRLRHKKDRLGCMPQELYFSVGDGHGGLAVEPKEPDEQDQGDSKGLIREHIVDVLRRQPERRFSQSAIEGLVKGKSATVRKELKSLAHDPDEPVRVEVGARNSLQYWYDPALDLQEPSI